MFCQVYLWIGKGANDKEKQEAVVTAQEYLKSHPAGRDLDTPILVEPDLFMLYRPLHIDLCYDAQTIKPKREHGA